MDLPSLMYTRQDRSATLRFISKELGKLLLYNRRIQPKPDVLATPASS